MHVSGSDPDDLRKLLNGIFESVAPKQKPDRYKVEAADHANRLLDELMAFASAKNPEEHMRNRLVASLKEVKLLMERTKMMAESFGWEFVVIEIANVDNFLSRVISAAEQVVPREELNKR